jgi:hypothetical protein
MKVCVLIVMFWLVALGGCANTRGGRTLWPETGRSREEAFVIRGETVEAGIREELAILQRLYPWVVKEGRWLSDPRVPLPHATLFHEGRMYSMYTIALEDGTLHDVFFDVTSRMGK